MRKHRPEIKKYVYEFEWEHGSTASMITYIGTKTPRSNKFVAGQSGASVIVYGMLSDEPFIKMSQAPLQMLGAIVSEIKRERIRLLEENRTMEVTTTSINEIMDHPTKSLSAVDYMEDE